jgi:hypothetical protein
VRAFGLVELQRIGQRLEHALGRTGQIPPLEAGVVVHRYPGQQRNLFAP